MEPTNNMGHTIIPSDRLLKIMIAVITVASIFVIGELAYQFSSLPQNAPKEISVSGEGRAYIKPDIALISFGVTSQAPKSQDAVNQNNEKMNAVIAAIKSLGVQDQDIQTTYYNLTPVYGYTPYPVGMGKAVSSYQIYPMPPVSQERKITGYSLEQQVSVKIRNFDNINTIVDKASTAGANTIGQLQFTVDNPEAARSEARQKAIDAAKTKMQNIAKESGLNVGKLVNVSEGYNSYPQPMYTGNAVAKDSVESVAPSIQTGQMEVSMNITLTYQIK